MKILIMSGPEGSLADALLENGVSTLVCVTQGNLHLRSRAGSVASGRNIALPQQIALDVPAVRSLLMKAYPLVDRWVGNGQSMSATLETMLEYTSTLIQFIGNYLPRFAVLETGAPHHLFTYCLDAALRYLEVPIYYLYGNAFDGRCLAVRGNEKAEVVNVTDYSPQAVIDDYVEQVQRNATYIPADSTRSLSPFLHGWRPYAAWLHVREGLARRYVALRKGAPALAEGPGIRLRLPPVGLGQLLRILKGHSQYRTLMGSRGVFAPESIGPNDVVYVGHMVPEATSFPESPDYPGEIDVLIDLKNRFPDSKVFYREHPAIALYSEFGHIHLQGLHKNPAFYEQLERLGIGLVPSGLHISKIRERGCLFATKTGRVAVENSVLGIPTLLYGYPFYGCDLPLAFHVGSLPARLTADMVRARAVEVTDCAAAVKTHLVARFSGSIDNPGIGLGNDASARPRFEEGVVRLVRLLGVDAAMSAEAQWRQEAGREAGMAQPAQG
ncbi:hypothetical protein ACIPEN_00560 [Herbaspirillum chlorophenolicum]|uniref:Capsule polysaccharide biosynthesis protein n=1 Tax=Herbaspirillum chlorophenolicum TaxID=211589 RepID=A0ABW8ES62_9BURK